MSCPDCFTGHIHTQTPTGSVTTLHGIPTYVAQPEHGSTPKGVIVVITDAFGWDCINSRILCDQYAKKGNFIVYCPDFMMGNAMHFDTVVPLMKGIMTPASWFTTLFYKPWYILHAMYNVIPWFIKNRQGVCRPRIFSWFKALRTSPPPYPTDSLKVGVAGFCWGGKFAFLLCADTPSSRVHRHESQVTASMLEPLIDCGFTAHPSMVNVPEDVEAVSLPLSVVVGNEDMAMKSADIKLMQEILTVKKKGDHEVNIIPGAKHGFAVREDPKDRFQGQCADKAEVQAIEWFTRWFA